MMMSADPFLGFVQAYALGALEGQDLLDFQAHLASGCAACGEGVSALASAALLLARNVPPRMPEPRIRDLVLALAEAPTLPVDLVAHSWEEPAPGFRQAIVREDPARDMTAALVWAKPGAHYPSHRHHGNESFLVLQGHCRDEEGEYRAGDIACKRAGSVHSVEFLPGEDCIGYVVSYGGHDIL